MNAFNNTLNGYRKVTSAFGLLGAVGLTLMVLITFADVILRYFIHSPIVGSQEMVEFLMIITMYGGMPYAASKGMLLSVDAVTKKFHPVARNILRLVFTIMCAVAACLMCWKVSQHFTYYVGNPMLTSPILKWSYAPFYGYAALGLGLLSIEMILEIGVSILAFSKHGSTNEAEKEGEVNG